MPDGSEQEIRMKFMDGIAIQIDDDGDVPLFEDPVVMTYPSIYDVEQHQSLKDDIEAYTGRPFDTGASDICFDVAIMHGIHHRMSEIVKR